LVAEVNLAAKTRRHKERLEKFMIDKGKLEQAVISVLKTCFDPEIPVDIWELGLIYGIKIDDEGNTYIKMTLTSPACPVAGSLPGDVKEKVKNVNGIKDVYVDLVWEPAWSFDKMTEEAKLELGFL
jgi:FeS assembly SUF system protein